LFWNSIISILYKLNSYIIKSALNFAFKVLYLNSLLRGGLKLSIPIPGYVFIKIIIREPFKAARL